MKILKIALQGINSIKDKHIIDLTHDAYTRQGIFAITGATGAGKTTILDTICLAIYGRTPRLDVISQNNNELMNKQSGECLAQVWLQINDKQYSFLFTQRRARNSPTGKLQPAKREIYEVVGAEQILLENQTNKTNALAAKLLQMDFYQFTRSVMLAQGSFAAFLHSDINKRGELLEKITGTDIYAKISMQVYQTHKQKSQELALYQQKISDVQLLTDDEYTNLLDSMKNTNQQYDSLNHSLEQMTDRLHKKQQYDILLSDKIRFNESLLQHQDKLKTFDEKIELIKKAAHVDIIKPIYQNYLDNQKELNHHQEQLSKFLLEENKLNHAYSNQQKITQNAQQILMSAHQHLENLLPKIQQARAIDKDIEKQNTNVSINQDFLNQKNNLWHKNKLCIDELNQTLNTHHHNKNQITKQLKQLDMIANIKQTYDEEEFLIEPYKIWHQNLNQRQDDLLGDTGIMTLYQQMMQYQEDIKKDINVIYSKHKQLKQIQQQQQSCYDKINIYKAQHNISCDTSSYLDELEKQKISYINKLNDIRQIKADYERLLRDQNEHHHSSEQINKTKQALNDLLLRQNHLDTSITTANKQLQTAKDNYELAKDNDLLHHYFLQLKDNTPCPLCGSYEHPRKNQENKRSCDNLATAKSQLSQQEALLNQLMDDYKKITQDCAIKNERIELLSAHYQKQEAIIHESQQALMQKLGAISQQTDIGLIDDIYERTQQKLNQINDDIVFLHDLLKDVDIFKNNMDDIINESHEYTLHLASLITHYNNIVHNINKTIHSINNDKSLVHSFVVLEDRLSQLKQLLQSDFSYFYALKNQINEKSFDSLKLMDDSTKKLSIKSLNDLGDFEDIQNIKHIFEYNHQIIDDIHQNHQGFLNDIQHSDKVKLMVDESYQLFDKYNTLQTKLNDINQMLDNTALQLNYENNTKQTLSKEMADLTEKLKEFAKNIQLLNDEKFQLIDTFDTEHLFNELNNKQQAAAADYQIQNEALQQLDRQLFDTKNNIKHNHQQIDLLDSKITQSLQQLQDKLTEFGFHDVASCLAYEMAPDVRAQIQHEHSASLQAISATKGQLAQIEQSIQHIVNAVGDVADIDSAILQVQITTDKQALMAHQERLFDIKNTLKQHDTNLKNKAQLLEQYQILALEFDLWDKLNTAIGSADGKKYRNIVQAITLSRVLALANEALATMNNRYILTNTKSADDDKDVDSLLISVIDTHQAHAVRAIKNLSGGETFLVSLALALGLSKIQSHQMSIDSLFLDEGFGTLDDEALDIALGALGELQQTGKMIGVISHIDSLKQRIGTHIEVSRISSGVSTIKGYGVQK